MRSRVSAYKRALMRLPGFNNTLSIKLKVEAETGFRAYLLLNKAIEIRIMINLKEGISIKIIYLISRRIRRKYNEVCY